MTWYMDLYRVMMWVFKLLCQWVTRWTSERNPKTKVEVEKELQVGEKIGSPVKHGCSLTAFNEYIWISHSLS